ncbi:acyl-CoA dehydrogenase [Streptomyces spectabilis]|uniref:Acyl-CoA dehydrogenase n=2 Tax=Streptomyces spectabilis TaxID=68270 RepID=A0A516R136_STRST|nr:acyl-CoA dehydrogenase [Streptomyces spectabilis]
MPVMEADNATCDALLPGLRESLSKNSLAMLEAENGPAIGLFRCYGGTSLLVPSSYGGTGATAQDAARVVRALGAVAPSMTVATMMHHFSIGSLFAIARAAPSPELEAGLGHIASQRALVASGFAEGGLERGILNPTIRARHVDGGYVISGAKKPCSLAHSMDLLTASVALPTPSGAPVLGMALLPAGTPGLTVHPFWSSHVLAGAESHEVRLTEVFVPEEQMLAPVPELTGRLAQAQAIGLSWFQLIVCAAYTGVVARLVRRVQEGARGSTADRIALAVRLESAAALTDGLARRLDDDSGDSDAVLGHALVTRRAVQDAVLDSAGQAVELLGGMAYVSSSEPAYLLAAAQAIAFHPPSRSRAVDSLAAYFTGRPVLTQ